MSYRKGLLRFIFLGVLLLAVSPVQAEEGKELFEKRCVAARGKALFTGERPLARIGPPCAACHRSTMRALPEGTLAKNLGDPADEKVLHDAGLDADGAAALYRLFTVATYQERNVIPCQPREDVNALRRRGEQDIGILSRPRGGL